MKAQLSAEAQAKATAKAEAEEAAKAGSEVSPVVLKRDAFEGKIVKELKFSNMLD